MVWKDNKNATKFVLKCRDKLIGMEHPLVMGILNITPDSFYAASRKENKEAILQQVSQMVAEGVDVIDIGGMSTRPGAEIISVQEEIDRLSGALSSIREYHPDVLISIDTYRAEVVKALTSFQIDMVNDVSGGLLDSEMHATVAEMQLPYILMHSRGNSQTMQAKLKYSDFPSDVITALSCAVEKARSAGITDVIIDPGFGFAKDLTQNYKMLRQLSFFHVLACPILVGVSRKSMIYKPLGLKPEEALSGTSVLHTFALQQGASILRVHDVKAAKEVIRLMQLIYNSI
jgi:dihydropteroate synthase